MEEPTKPLRPENPATGTIDMARQPVEAKIGPGGRLIGVLLSPTETFADINRKPTWLVPIIIVIVAFLCSLILTDLRAKPDWASLIRKQQEVQLRKRLESTGQQPSDADVEAQLDRASAFSKYYHPSFYVGSILWPFFVTFAVSGLFALGMLFVQAQTTFKRILSVFAWSYCATRLVKVIVSAASLMLKDSVTLANMDLASFSKLSASNLGVFMSPDSSPVLRSLATSLDVFDIWLIILLIVGLAAIGGSKRVTKGKTASVVLGLWAIQILIGLGFAYLGFGQ